MSRYIRFFKPFEVLCQFTDQTGRATLKDFIQIPHVYPAGRLDYLSEGLLILTDDGSLVRQITDPRFKHPKTYYVQVEGQLTDQTLQIMRETILLPGLQTRLVQVEVISEPDLPPRSKPVRAYHPKTWLKITLHEGKKHQIRRMTAALGFPTLRLIRVAIGQVTLDGLQPGTWKELDRREINNLMKGINTDFRVTTNRNGFLKSG
jgi:23S rRNA pseudouridine2457 synthase